jgi:hypothetical protein
VLLLVSLTYTTATLGPGGPWVGSGPEDGALSSVEDSIRRSLAEILDASVARAVEVAAVNDGTDVSSALDAIFTSGVREVFPREVLGWEVDLVDAGAGLAATRVELGRVGSPEGDWSPQGRARFSLTSASLRDRGAIELDVRVIGPPSSPNALAARAATLMEATSSSTGVVAYGARVGLWELAQARVLAGVRRPSEILSEDDVAQVLQDALDGLAGGLMPSVPDIPDLELGFVLRQSVEGALVSNWGWVDDYLFLGDGLMGLLSRDEDLAVIRMVLPPIEGIRALEASLRELAGAVVLEVAMRALEGHLEQVWASVGAEDLPGTIEANLEAVEGLIDRTSGGGWADGLATTHAWDLVRGALEGVLLTIGSQDGLPPFVSSLLDSLGTSLASGEGRPALLRGLAGHADRVLSVALRTVVHLALASTRDALLALKASGMEVAGIASDIAPSSTDDRLSVSLEDVTVVSDWIGEVACEPRGLLAMAVGVGLDGGPFPLPVLGSLPYTSVCKLTLEGSAMMRGLVPSSTGGPPMSVAWRVPVSMGLSVPMVTGWALDGVLYMPSTTLVGDLIMVAKAVYADLGGALGWFTHRLRDAGEWVMAQARGLCEDFVENVLARSAYTLSQALWRIGDQLVKRRSDQALNHTWDLLMDLMAKDIQERLTWEVGLWGSLLVVSIDVQHQQLEVTLDGEVVRVELSLRRLSDPHPPFKPRPIEGYHWGVFGQVVMDKGNGVGARIVVDPLTLEHSSVLTLSAAWGKGPDGRPTGELVVEAMEARRLQGREELRLSALVDGMRVLSYGGQGACVDAGLALHGEFGREGDLRALALKALKDAWLASVRGWSLGELLGREGPSVDGPMFLETLFRELRYALLERSSSLVTEVEAFLEVDLPTAGWPDLRLSLVLRRPLEVLLPLQVWVSRELAGLLDGVASGGLSAARMGLATTLAELVVVRFELVWELPMPAWLHRGALGGAPDDVGLVIRGEANLAALAALFGGRWGRWEARMEVLIRGVPGQVLSLVPGMGSSEWRWAEIVLFRLALRDIRPPRVLISQVLYDVEGRDLDLEFVELRNDGRGIVDLEGYMLADDGGTFPLRGHLPLLPGDLFLVVRNGTAVRDRWGVVADLGRMSLRLANDGDEVRLMAPDGVMLDQVSWEGHLEGWEEVEAREGWALLRKEGDTRVGEPGAWKVDRPSPRRSDW